MTGIFLIRSIRLGLDSYTLLIGALLMGGVGAFSGVLGAYYFPFFYVSSSLLGIERLMASADKSYGQSP